MDISIYFFGFFDLGLVLSKLIFDPVGREKVAKVLHLLDETEAKNALASFLAFLLFLHLLARGALT